MDDDTIVANDRGGHSTSGMLVISLNSSQREIRVRSCAFRGDGEAGGERAVVGPDGLVGGGRQIVQGSRSRGVILVRKLAPRAVKIPREANFRTTLATSYGMRKDLVHWQMQRVGRVGT